MQKNYLVFFIPLVLVLIIIFLFIIKNNSSSKPSMELTEEVDKLIGLQQENAIHPSFSLKTDRGDIKIILYSEFAPKTVENFISKVNSNYYEGLTFHRVEDWVIQGGDPLGNGTGGGDMPTELSQKPFKEGSIGVARGGNIEISNDSQFFICTTDCAFLTGEYTNFGDVVSGMDVAKATSVGDKIISISPVAN